MSLTNAQRAARRDAVLGDIRPYVWRRKHGRPIRVELTLQRGRSRPRVTGIVAYVASSGAFVHLRDDDWPDDVAERLAPTLHVPVDAIRSVRPAP